MSRFSFENLKPKKSSIFSMAVYNWMWGAKGFKLSSESFNAATDKYHRCLFSLLFVFTCRNISITWRFPHSLTSWGFYTCIMVHYLRPFGHDVGSLHAAATCCCLWLVEEPSSPDASPQQTANKISILRWELVHNIYIVNICTYLTSPIGPMELS